MRIRAATLHRGGVLIPRGATLPRVCLSCGTKKKRLLHRDRLGNDVAHPVVHGNPVVALAGNLLVLLIRLSRARHRAVTLPHWRCAKCDARLQEAASISPLLLVGPFAGLLVGLAVGFATTPAWGWGAGAAVMISVIVVARRSARSGIPVAVESPECTPTCST